LTSPNGQTKYINPGYPGLIDQITDSRTADRLMPEDAYVRSSWLRRCVDVRADALASIPFTIQRDGDTIYDSAGFDQIPDEIEWLSEIETLLKLTEASLTLAGAAYWVPQVRRGRPRSIDWIAPNLMEPNYSASGEIVSYERTLYVPDGGYFVPKTTTIAADFVTAFFARDPYTEVGPGNSVAMSVRVNADVLYALDQFLDSYMDRGLLPATIIAVPANTPPEERNRFQQWWDRYYRGKTRGGTQKVLNADSVKVERIGDGIGQLGASDVVKQQREAIASGVGVPMSKLLPGSGDAKAGVKENEQFYTDTVIPSAKRIQIDINRNLLRKHGLYFRFEFKRIEALQRANLETARTVQRLVEKPVLTQNEGRGVIGYRPSEEDGADELASQDTRLANEASSLAVQESSSDPDERPREPKKAAPHLVDIAILHEVEAWKKKAKNKGRDCEFVCRVIPPLIEAEIRKRLLLPDDQEPLEKAFDPPYVRI